MNGMLLVVLAPAMESMVTNCTRVKIALGTEPKEYLGVMVSCATFVCLLKCTT